MDNKELNSIIKLLDDPDENIYGTISNKLIEQGSSIILKLENAWEKSTNVLLQSRLEEIIQTIQFSETKKELYHWKEENQDNLLYGAYVIAKFQYPEIKFEDIQRKIEAIKKEVWIELSNNLTALEKVKVINHIFFKILGFKKNASNQYSPQNAFINDVLDTKKGNQISLAILYAIIAQELNLPIFGVDLPASFILAYKDELSIIQKLDIENDVGILFYINPFNKGAVFGKKEINYFLKQQKTDPQKSYYSVCSNSKTLERLVDSLIESYKKLGYVDKIKSLNELLQILKER